jgi:hypothetical protein
VSSSHTLGGSRTLGGPLRGGELSMFSDKFLLNTRATSLQTAFTLKKTSLITLFISNNLWMDLSGQILIQQDGTWKALVPFHSHKTYAQAVYFFLVENIKVAINPCRFVSYFCYVFVLIVRLR